MNMKRLAILLGISAQLGCLVHAKPDQLEIRKKWKTDDELEIYNFENQVWLKGQIKSVRGDVLTVEYRVPKGDKYRKITTRDVDSLRPIVNRNTNTQSVKAQTMDQEEHPGNVRISTNTNILKPQTAHSSAANPNAGKQVTKPLGKTAKINTKPTLTRAVSPKPKPASRRAVSPKSEEKTEELPQLVNPLAAPPVHVHASKGPLKRTLSLDSDGYALTPRQSEEFYYKQLKPLVLASIDNIRKQLKVANECIQKPDGSMDKLKELTKEKTVAEDNLASVSARKMKAMEELKKIDTNIDELTGIVSNKKEADTKEQQGPKMGYLKATRKQLASERRELKIRFAATSTQLDAIEEEFSAIKNELDTCTAPTKSQLAAIQEKMLQNRKDFDTNKNESTEISREIMELNAKDNGNDEKLRKIALQAALAAKRKTKSFEEAEALDKLIKRRSVVMKKIETLTEEEARARKNVEATKKNLAEEKPELLAKINPLQKQIEDLTEKQADNYKKLAEIESALADLAELK